MKIPCGYFLMILQLHFWISTCENHEIKLSMPKNYGINIFDYEGPRSLTHMVALLCELLFQKIFQFFTSKDKFYINKTHQCIADGNFLVRLHSDFDFLLNRPRKWIKFKLITKLSFAIATFRLNPIVTLFKTGLGQFGVLQHRGRL